MITYDVNEWSVAAKMASEDTVWTKRERAILSRIAELMNEDFDDELQKEEFGTGTIYGVRGSSIRFLFHVGAQRSCKTPLTTNIGRA